MPTHTAIIDTHLHLYPEYNLSQAFHNFINRSAPLGAKVSRVACLAERHDCKFFKAILTGETVIKGFETILAQENEIKLRHLDDAQSFTLLPGRQIITSENIEILALACNETIDDKQPALDVIYQINQSNGVPVVAWSPGKWFGKRGKLVNDLINQLSPDDFMLGDTTLRPYGWGLPRLMKIAQSKGFGIIAGSDPLPFVGEEHWLGTYYSVVETEKHLSATQLLHAMKTSSPEISFYNYGKRSNVFSLFQRLRKNAASKK